MGVACVDVDAFLERKHGRSAAELFGELGEDALRELEYEALVECANMGPSLISCGEGIVAFDKSRELLKRRGFAVMLESSEATSLGRIHNLSTRPLLAHDCDIEGLWEQRKPLYEEVARAKINVQGRSTGSVAGFVAKVLARAGVYTPDSEDAVAKKIEADSLKRHKNIGIRRAEGRVRRRSAQMLRTRAKKGCKSFQENAASSKKYAAHAPASGQGAAEKSRMVLVRLSTVVGEEAAGEARCAPRTIVKTASAARRPPIKSRKEKAPKWRTQGLNACARTCWLAASTILLSRYFQCAVAH